jgi:hypothetical protein
MLMPGLRTSLENMGDVSVFAKRLLRSTPALAYKILRFCLVPFMVRGDPYRHAASRTDRHYLRDGVFQGGERSIMKPARITIAFLFVMALLAGCASTQVTEQTPVQQMALPRPNTIYVYNFIASQKDIPSDTPILSSLSQRLMPASAEEEDTGRQLGAAIARDLTADINAMGMYAVQAGPGSQPQVGDAVIRGYIVSAESGSMGKRFVLGFGSGASQLETVVEGYAVTKYGWRKVGSGTLNAQGNKAPGLVVPGAIAIATGNPIGLAVMGGVKVYGQVSGRNTLEGRAKSTSDEIAKQLRVRFQQRGWIS